MTKPLEKVERKLTSWEAFNYILHGLVNEAIDVFKVNPKVKVVAFQLWAAYLRRHESAFFNDEEEALPKLPARFNQHDYNLLVNMIKKRKHSDALNETKCTKFKIERSKVDRKMLKKGIGKKKLGRAVLFVIMYCAINYYEPNIQISDILRTIWEGKLSFYECRHFLPPDISEDEKHRINALFKQSHKYIKHTELSIAIHQFTYFCKVDLNPANMYVLFERYVTELALPKLIYKIVERLFSFCPTDFGKLSRNYNFPLYDGRAMAYIIFALKLLFGLNGLTEFAMSKSAQKLNAFVKQQEIVTKKFFVWTEWVEYCVARKQLLMKYYHQNENEYKNSNQSTLRILNFHEKVINYEKNEKSLNNEEINELPRFMRRRMHLITLMQKIKAKKEQTELSTIEFPPSLTPIVTNLEVLKSLIDVPDILQENFRQRDIKYLLGSSKLKKKFRKKRFCLKSIEAPSNTSISYIKHKKSKKLRRTLSCEVYRLFELNSDLKTFLIDNINEAKQKDIQREKEKNDPKLKEDLDKLKKHTKKVMKRKRRSFKPDDDCLFSQIESSSDSEPDEDTTATFYKPNFEYWTYVDYPRHMTHELYELMSRDFSESFKWLLETCAVMVQMKPHNVYFELLTIETQFLYILKPMYKIKDKLLYQDMDHLGNNIRSTVKHLSKRFKDGRMIY